VVGPNGSITGLVPPASATYIAGTGTFIFQQNANVAANIDVACVYFRNTTVSSFKVEVCPPAGLTFDYNITLPTLPATQKFMTLDASGNMAAPWEVDNSTIAIVADQLVVQPENLPRSSREHAWELNGPYPSLTFPLNDIDAVFFVPYNCNIQAVWIYCGDIGASGVTTFDLKKRSAGGAWTSILSTLGTVTATTALTSIVSAGTLATATLVGHGFINGETVVISGASPAAYNGTFVIANVAPNTFDYTMLSAPGVAATGGVVATRQGVYTDSNAVIGSQAGVVKPVLASTALVAGEAIRWDLTTSMIAPAADARIRIFYQ
jgi:hypothetical protein